MQPGSYRCWTKMINNENNFLYCKPCGRSAVLTYSTQNIISHTLGQLQKQILFHLSQNIKQMLVWRLALKLSEYIISSWWLVLTTVNSSPGLLKRTSQIQFGPFQQRWTTMLRA
ncbi:Hypothetical_protein [Hexamita inflata]|uniref:Hypothetical_protein n=1 Tax=Hexamita inflata TaxID=28002 RepID=A0ABP1HND1_9EUKA